MNRRIRYSLLIGLSALLTLASGRASAQTTAREELREEFHQSYPVSANARVTLENINGSVRIAAADQNEVRVDAVKHAYTQERLAEAKIVVDADANGVHVRTRYPSRDMNFTDDDEGRYRNPASVEYTLTVPRHARLDSIELINGDLVLNGLAGDVNASCINGRTTAQELTGEVKLSNINGKLEATFARLEESHPISLNSVNGQIVLTVPSDANAVLKASTVHGDIANDLGLPVHHGRYVGNDLAGQLGRGGARVKLSNVNGRIQIRRAGDGRTASPVTNLLGNTKNEDEDEGEAQSAVQRDVAREVARELRESQSEIARAVEEATREAQRASAEAARETAQSAREVERAKREIERANRQAERARERSLRDAELTGRDRQRESELAARAGELAAREGALVAREVAEAMRSVQLGQLDGENSYSTYRLIERESKSFPVSGTPRVRLETFDGPIQVLAWNKAEVMYMAVKRARDERAMRGIHLRAEQGGADISIVAEFDKTQPRTSAGTGALVALEVYVPRNANVRVYSGDGRVRLEGVNGECELKTGDGSVDAANSQGRLRVETGDGRIRVVAFDGEASVQTGDGRITLDGRFNQLSARTGDGSISLSLSPDVNATIETNASSVTNDGLAISEDGDQESRRVRRWKVGRGGNLFTLRTGDGRIYLRRTESAHAVTR